MKNPQKIQLGSMTVLVVALMQAGLVHAGFSGSPGIQIDTSVIPTLGTCTSSGNPMANAQSYCSVQTAPAGTMTLSGFARPDGYHSAMTVGGNALVINTINFSGSVYGGNHDALVFNSSSNVNFNLVSGLIQAYNSFDGVSGAGFTFGNGANVFGGYGNYGRNSSSGGSGISGTGFTVNNLSAGTITGGNGGYTSLNDGTNANGATGSFGGSSGVGGAGGAGGVGGAGSSVGANGTAGGAGISGSGFSVDNQYLITGGKGGSGGGANGGRAQGGYGGYGGIGGSGGAGGIGGAGGAAGVSGAGGAGISGSNFSVNNQVSGTISGGAGGYGGYGGYGGSAQGGNGGGTNGGSNGNGGAGGTGGNGGTGGAGGVGGAGISGSNFSVNNQVSGTISGGAGGVGYYGGVGGSATGGNSYGNNGDGGTGGNGGTGGAGGVGGAGVTGSSFTLTNRGTIRGGDGGTAGYGGDGGNGSGGGWNGIPGATGTNGANGSMGVAGAGGVGVVSTGNATIINYGAIFGGLADNGNGPRADALNLSGAGNTLRLETNSMIYGNVISNALTTVAGDSTITGLFANSGSVAIAAGKILAVTGDFTNTGTFTPVVTNAGFGKLTATGIATLTGSTLFVDASTLTSANTYGGTVNGVIQAGSIAGTFASSSDNSTLFNFTPVYTATNVNLTIASAGSSNVANAVAANNNTAAQGAAAALDQIIVSNPGGAIAAIFMPLTTTKEVSDAASQTVPQVAGVVSQVLTTNLDFVNRIVQSRQDGQHGKSSGDSFYGDQKFWFKPFGSWADQDSQNGVPGYKSDSYGMIFGADANLSDVNRVGVAFSYSKTDVDSKGVASQNADIDSYTALVYGSHRLNATSELNFHGGVGLHNTDGGRTISIGSTNSRANSSYDSWSANVGAGVAHTISLSEKTSLTPSIRIDYSRIRSDAYSESGAGVLNLNVGKNTSEALVLGVDGKLSHAISDRATLVANFGVGYDLINDRSSLTSAFAGAPTVTFTTQGIDPSPWLARGGFGVIGKVTETMEVTARYDFEVRENFDNQTASVKARWMF